MEPTKDTQKAKRTEAAGAQAVERGHKVHMYEVPDQEDDTSFMMNMKANLIPTIEIAVTLPTVVKPSRVNTKAEKVPHEWLKPFRAEWTLHGIMEAKTESEAKAILKNWIHKARVKEVVDEMIEGMRKGGPNQCPLVARRTMTTKAVYQCTKREGQGPKHRYSNRDSRKPDPDLN